MGVCVLGALVAGCRRHDDEPPVDPDACATDADCAHLDDGDTCFAPPTCDVATMRCSRRFLQNDTDCQCTFGPHCWDLGYEERGCNIVDCDYATHQCSEEIVPEGLAPRPRRGDCTDVFCDGTSPDAMPRLAPDDFDDDGNTCTVDACSEVDMGVTTHEPLADGLPCLDASGICYGARCYPGCVPEDFASCGTEGERELYDDTAEGADLVPATDVCGMLDGTDIDWVRKRIEDASFMTDILTFEVHSTAPAIELCAYVRCSNWMSGGRPGGGCREKIAGPVAGSWGCCWQGSPETVRPRWDLDCPDTSDDEGYLWYSLRAIGGDACETYALSVSY